MESVHDIASRLAFAGAFDGIDAARTAVDALIAENRILVTDEGYVDDLDYMDIMAALRK